MSYLVSFRFCIKIQQLATILGKYWFFRQVQIITHDLILHQEMTSQPF